MLGLIVLGLVAAASANVVVNGNCPETKPVENFDLSKYAGNWYEISKYPYEAEKKGKCAHAEYTLENNVFKVKNVHIVDGVQTSVEGSAKFAEDAKNAAKLLVTLKIGDTPRESPIQVLSTDYKNYAIVYNCKYDATKKNHQDNVWVLSRTKKLEGEAKTAVDTFVKNNPTVVDATKLQTTDFSEEACKFTSTATIAAPPKQ